MYTKHTDINFHTLCTCMYKQLLCVLSSVKILNRNKAFAEHKDSLQSKFSHKSFFFFRIFPISQISYLCTLTHFQCFCWESASTRYPNRRKLCVLEAKHTRMTFRNRLIIVKVQNRVILSIFRVGITCLSGASTLAEFLEALHRKNNAHYGQMLFNALVLFSLLLLLLSLSLSLSLSGIPLSITEG